MEKLKQAIEILNGVSENVWAMLIVCLSIALFIKGQSAAGGTLVSGGLALFQRK
jgi:hypothetical protein